METIIRQGQFQSNPLGLRPLGLDWNLDLCPWDIGKDFSIYDLFFQWIPSNLCPRGFAARAKNHQKIQLSTFVYQNWPVTRSSSALDPPEYL